MSSEQRVASSEQRVGSSEQRVASSEWRRRVPRALCLMLILLSITATATATATDDIFRAMHDELDRSMRELRIGDLPRPYHIEYLLTKRHRVGAHAILGTVDDLDTSTVMTLTVRVRVGDPSFDNTNFFDVSLGFFGSSDDEEGFKNRRLALEPSYEALRRELWLATDACYKQAVEVYAKKTASLKNRTRSDTTWDYTLMPAEVVEDLSHQGLTIAPEQVTRMVESVSAVFRDAPHVHGSRVGMEFVPEEVFYLNTEGRRMHKFDCFTGFEMIAVTQAPDGMPLSDAYAAYSIDPEDLPSVDSLKRAANAMIQNLRRQQAAPTMEPYSGPVLFEGQAAAQVLAQEFAPNLVAQRKPLSEGGFSTGDRTYAFQNKIGARVLPEFLTVKALPSMDRAGDTPVAGHYELDDEGIEAEDVILVENGYLKTLLASRVPTRRVRHSNGHHRGGGAMLSVIDVTCKDESRRKDPQAMRARLLELVRDRELEYGVIVRSVLDRNLLMTGLFPMLMGDFSMRLEPGSLLALEAVKLYPDGREEPLRGTEIAGLSTFAFKDILNVGTSGTVHNYLAPSVIPAFISGGAQFVMSTIITPDLLFEDVEIRQQDGDLPTLPHLASPLK